MRLKQALIALLGLIVLAIALSFCDAGNEYNLLIENKDNIFIIGLGETAGDMLYDIGELLTDLNADTDKEYKFIIISEDEAQKITAQHGYTEPLKAKILAGYNLIYYQPDKNKLNAFLSKFFLSRSLETGSGNILVGCVLHRDINYALHTGFVNGHPVFSTTATSQTDFIKMEMTAVIRNDAAYGIS